MSEKLNLNQSNVNFYWKNIDPRMSKIITIMERVEHWVVDDVESVARELISVGKKMSSSGRTSLTRKSDDLIVVMAYITCGKALRILNWLDDHHNGLSFHYVTEARQMEDFDPGKLLLDRLKTIKTLSLLTKVFSPTRTRLISEILREKEDEDE